MFFNHLYFLLYFIFFIFLLGCFILLFELNCLISINLQSLLYINGIIHSSIVFMAYEFPVWHIISLFSWCIDDFNIYELRSIILFLHFSSMAFILRKLSLFRDHSHIYFCVILLWFLSFHLMLRFIWNTFQDMARCKNLSCFFFSVEVGHLPNCLTNSPFTALHFLMPPLYSILLS